MGIQRSLTALIFTALMAVTMGQYLYPEITGIIKEEWNLFKLEYNKYYDSPEEEHFRMKIYMDNYMKVIDHNKLFVQNLTTYNARVNHLSDMLPHEVMTMMNGLRGDFGQSLGSTYVQSPIDLSYMPVSMDWRERGAVTDVKNQKQCGSCWAFSAVGSLEGQYARKTGRRVSLSEQDLIDCCHKCSGCNGGLMTLAFSCLKEEGGIENEDAYPYEGHEGPCKFKRSNSAATVTGWVSLQQGDEMALMEAVTYIGPISVGIDAGHHSFLHYNAGIYDEPSCSDTDLDHGVLVVGYGTEDGVDYWIVKNSWGPLWGEHGYIRMARNKNNMCGIASLASYPLV